MATHRTPPSKKYHNKKHILAISPWPWSCSHILSPSMAAMVLPFRGFPWLPMGSHDPFPPVARPEPSARSPSAAPPKVSLPRRTSRCSNGWQAGSGTWGTPWVGWEKPGKPKGNPWKTEENHGKPMETIKNHETPRWFIIILPLEISWASRETRPHFKTNPTNILKNERWVRWWIAPFIRR